MTEFIAERMIYTPQLDRKSKYGNVGMKLKVPKGFPAAKYNAEYDEFVFEAWESPDDPRMVFAAKTYSPGQVDIPIGWDGADWYWPEMNPQTLSKAEQAVSTQAAAAPAVAYKKPSITLDEFIKRVTEMADALAYATESVMESSNLSEDAALRLVLSASIAMDKKENIRFSDEGAQVVPAVAEVQEKLPERVIKEHEAPSDERILSAAQAVAAREYTDENLVANFFVALLQHDPTGYYTGETEKDARLKALQALKSADYTGSDLSALDPSSLETVAKAAYNIARDIVFFDVSPAEAAEAHKKAEDWEPIF